MKSRRKLPFTVLALRKVSFKNVVSIRVPTDPPSPDRFINAIGQRVKRGTRKMKFRKNKFVIR